MLKIKSSNASPALENVERTPFTFFFSELSFYLRKIISFSHLLCTPIVSGLITPLDHVLFLDIYDDLRCEGLMHVGCDSESSTMNSVLLPLTEISNGSLCILASADCGNLGFIIKAR